MHGRTLRQLPGRQWASQSVHTALEAMEFAGRDRLKVPNGQAAHAQHIGKSMSISLLNRQPAQYTAT